MKLQHTVEFDVVDIAQEFAHSFSDQQARFLTEVAHIAANWSTPAEYQWSMLARDLNRDASWEECRQVKEMLESIASRIEV
jgi:hypothetical protein